jgi:hypothetical protein
MDLISLIVVIAVVGVIVWAVTTYVPMPPPFRNVIILVAVLVVCLWVLSLFVPLPSLRVGR